MIKLFHVSKTPGISTLIPKVPDHFLTRHELEEGTTARISFAPSIEKCLRAVQSRPGITYYVYTPTFIDKKYLRRVSVYDVPDARLTGEYWYLRPAPVRLYAVIKSGKLYGAEVFRVGGVGKMRPKDRPLFAISNNREYELLERYNKRGNKMRIEPGIRNEEPKPLTWREKLFGKKKK